MSPEQKLAALKQILDHVKHWQDHSLDYSKCLPESAQAAIKILFPRGIE